MATKSIKTPAMKKAAVKKTATKKVAKRAAKKASKPVSKPSPKKIAKPAARPAMKKAPKPAAKASAKKSAVANDSAALRIDSLIAQTADWRGERLAEIRALIHEVDPQVIEEWKWMGTPVWSHDGMFVLANPHKGKVKLQFFHGAQLPDPKQLFNNGLDGGKWRAIDFHEGDNIDRSALKALLRAAIDYNTAHSVAKSKGSRLR